MGFEQSLPYALASEWINVSQLSVEFVVDHLVDVPFW